MLLGAAKIVLYPIRSARKMGLEDFLWKIDDRRKKYRILEVKKWGFPCSFLQDFKKNFQNGSEKALK